MLSHPLAKSLLLPIMQPWTIEKLGHSWRISGRARVWGARALEFAILTATRSGEVRGATWDEIDLTERLWTIPCKEGIKDEHTLAELIKWHIADLDTETDCELVQLTYEILKYRWADAVRAPHLASYRCKKLAQHEREVARWVGRLTKAGRVYGLDVSVVQSASQEQLDCLARRFLSRVPQHLCNRFSLAEQYYAQIGLPYFRDGRNLSEGRPDPNDHMSRALNP